MPDDPLDLFRETTRRLNAEDWAGAADLCDPASLAEFRRGFLWKYTSPKQELLTPEFYLQQSPDLPREVAEYRAQQQQKYADPLVKLREDLPRIASLDQLHSLSPKDLFVAWLVQHSTRNTIELRVEAGKMSRTTADRMLANLGGEFSYAPLGVVPDGEHVAYVLYRSEPVPEAWQQLESELERSELPFDEQELRRDLFYREHPGIMTCHRTAQSSWRALASHTFFGIGSYLWWFPDENTGEEKAD